jgi:hypothetical protein
MTTEGVVGLIAGFQAGSIALIGVRFSISSRSKSAAPWKIGSSPVRPVMTGKNTRHASTSTHLMYVETCAGVPAPGSPVRHGAKPYVP